MSEHIDIESDTSGLPTTSWRGRRGAAVPAAPRGWQQPETPQPLDEVQTRVRRRRVQIAAFLLLLLVLFGVWLYVLLFQAIQTPLVAVVATDYPWPFPPNAFAREDVLGLQTLHRRTLHVVEADPAWSGQEPEWRDFERKLREQKRRITTTSAVIIYISLHGLVNEQGEPCLVPPGASPWDSAAWLPVRQVLARIRAQAWPDRLTKLLVLDCNRVAVNWPLGVLDNGFAERLPAVVREANLPGLIVLNSAGPGQSGWVAPDLSGSVFGHFLRRALAGAADRDGNRRVTIGELHEYLQTHVNQWVQARRADRQEPWLIAGPEAMHQDIAWVTRAPLPPPEADEPEVPLADVRELWQARDNARTLQPVRFAPAAWSTLEQRLLWLEQLATGGRAYAAAAAALRDELKRQFAELEKRRTAASQVARPARRVWGGDEETRCERLTLHTLPLAQRFGRVDGVAADQCRDAWERFVRTPSAATLSAALTPLSPAPPAAAPPSFTESQFLRLAERFALTSDPPPARYAEIASVFAIVRQGEQVAVPDDERAAAWVRPAIDAADRQRRAAEDALASGDAGGLAAAVRAVHDQYAAAGKLADRVAAALQLRDETWAALPSLAQWLARPLPRGPSSAEADQEINQRLLRLIRNVHRLDAQLASPGGSPEQLPDATVFAKLTQDVAQDREALEQLFRTTCEKLEKRRQPSAVQIRELQAVLATPLLTAHSRAALFERLARCDAALSDGAADEEPETPAEEPAPPATAPGTVAEDGGPPTAAPDAERAASADAAGEAEEPVNPYRTRIETRWTVHPAVLLLAGTEAANSLPPARPAKSPDAVSSPAAAGPGSPVAAGGTDEGLPKTVDAARLYVRQRLRDIARQVAVAAAPSAPTVAEADTPAGLVKAYLQQSRPARLVRIAAPLGLPPLPADPIAALQRFEQQQLLLWHGGRTLDDFRGAAEPRREAFFSLAAADYLEDADFYRDAHPALLRHRETLRTRLAAGREAARRGLSVAAGNVLLLDPDEACRSRVIVTPAAGLATGELPHGRLALTVLHAGRPVAGVRFAAKTQSAPGDADGLPFPLSEPRELELLGNPLSALGPPLEVAAVFRGNCFAAPFLVQRLGGVTIDYAPTLPGPTRVTLQGFRRQRKSLVFILDCSESMQEETAVEATDGRRMPRLEVAKSALQGMLDQLAQQGETRVGVRLFGHRVGWSTKEPIRVLRQVSYARPVPPDLSPAEDVELVLPLGRFDSVMAGQVAELLRSVKPWGQTPLYRALVEAARDFDADDADTDKHIIVISDGVNYQFTPAASGQFAPPRPAEMDDVVAAWDKHKPAIHMVGFGIPARELAEAERAYRQLVERTRGTAETTAAEAQALLRRLDDLLGASQYHVRTAQGQEAAAAIAQDGSVRSAAGPAHLGEPAVIQPAPQSPQTYTVSCQDARAAILLRGGEQAVLELSGDGRRIDSVAYLEGAPKFARLVDGRLGTPSGYTIGAHRPIAEPSGVRFTVSLQHEQRRFAARPAETWIEVTPLLADGTPITPRYPFYDAEFDPQAPVPVLRWVAHDWPAKAKQAAFRVWCKAEATPADVVLPLAQTPAAPAPRQTLPELPHVELQVEQFQRSEQVGVRVVEWHGERSAGVGSLKVQWAGPPNSATRPQRIVHVFDAAHHVAVHVFLFPRLPQGLAGHELRITRAEALRAEALGLDKPIEVSIAAAPELLPPASEARTP